MSYHSNPLSHQRAPPKKLQIILVNTIHDNKSSLLEVSSWITVSELKSKIEKAFGVPVTQQRLFFQTQELNQNNFSMTSLGGKKRIKLILRPTPNLENTMGLVKKYETLPREESLDSLLFSVQEGFNVGLIPKLTFDGTSGSYFLQNKYRKNVAIFKPFDEEPFAPNNPKGYIGKLGSPGFRGGILSGESAIREVVSYLLDDRGFSGVPPTTFVEIIHPYFSKRDMKEAEISQGNSLIPIQNFAQYTGEDRKNIIKHGSLQKFVENAEEASDYGPKLFPDEEVRKIAMLDLRILNCDRNEGNILVKKEKGIIRLIPIDHGLSFPDSFQACTYDLVWMEWPQAKKKWTPLELDYISRINPKADTEKIAKHFKFRDTCLRNFRIAETVLKRCATAGMLLYDIGNILYREDPDFPSPIEEIIRKTEELCHTIQCTVPKGIASILKKAPRVNGMKERRIREEEKENNGMKNRAKLGGAHRTRAFSEDISMFEEEEQLQSQKIFQSILEQTNQSDLFTIPELTRPLGSDGSHLHKVSSKIQNVGSDHTLSEDDNEFENEIERSLLPEDQPNKILRRSSSIPAFLTRVGSNEEAKKENGKDAVEPKENSVFYTSKRVTTKGLSRLQEKKDRTPKHMDELFFKYFDGFLEQKIEIVMKNKQAPPTRSRFYSDM